MANRIVRALQSAVHKSFRQEVLLSATSFFGKPLTRNTPLMSASAVSVADRDLTGMNSVARVNLQVADRMCLLPLVVVGRFTTWSMCTTYHGSIGASSSSKICRVRVFVSHVNFAC